MKNSDFLMERICRIYLGMYKTIDQLPFSGHHWLEHFLLEVVQLTLDDHKDECKFKSKKPVDICRTYLDFLNKLYPRWVADYRLEKSNDDNLLFDIKRENCSYSNFCLQLQKEDLPLFCIQLGSIQTILKIVLNENYSHSVKIDETGICHGNVLPSTQPKEEIVTREGHTLKLAGRKAILFPQEMYASMLMSIREHAPHALKHVLFDAGYQSGLHTIRKTKALYDDVEECLRFLFDALTNSGFGRVELDYLDPTIAKARIRCHDSFQVAVTNEFGQLYRSRQVICDLLRGVFTAYLSVLLNQDIICEEISCQSVGGDYCEFLALPSLWEKGSEEGARG
ncbi:MAG: 4-vinyl reductase [Desulfotomaculaceae bacterium]|nr:4-vinyl reductase [Desulfotomaculaceae bacterium]